MAGRSLRHYSTDEKIHDGTRGFRETHAKLIKKDRINTREILSACMLASEYVEHLDGEDVSF